MSEKPDSGKITSIVEAARKRFAHYGLGKTTMNEIAADIGMSKAALYYYFPDKERLFIEVIKHEMEKFFSEVNEIATRPMPADEQLRQYVDLRFRCFQQFVNLSKLGSTHLQAVKSAYAPVNDDFIAREKEIIAGILRSGVKKKTFERMDTVAQADLFVSVLRALRMMIMKQRDDFSMTEEDYRSLLKYQTAFTAGYIKGISKAIAE